MVTAMNKMKEKSYNPGNASLLYMYARYKQATRGDVTGPRPNGFMKTMERRKWDAWNELRGMSAVQAMNEYVVYGKEILNTNV